MNNEIDLMGIGECLVEFVEGQDGRYQRGYAGDVLNCLSMASFLKLSTGIVSSFGNDPFLLDLKELLNTLNVDQQCVTIVSSPNGVYFVQRTNDAKPRFHFLRKHSAATMTLWTTDNSVIASYLSSAKAVITSSIACAVMNRDNRLVELLKQPKGSTKLYFDLNVRKSLWEDIEDLKRTVIELAGFVDVLFVTNDDDDALYGRRPLEEAMQFYLALGFPVVIGRRGAGSTLVASGDAVTEVSVASDVQVRDTTGAGDAFNAGFICSRLKGESIEQAAVCGNACAAAIIEHYGGRSSNVDRGRIEEFVRQITSLA